MFAEGFPFLGLFAAGPSLGPLPHFFFDFLPGDDSLDVESLRFFLASLAGLPVSVACCAFGDEDFEGVWGFAGLPGVAYSVGALASD